MHCHSMTLQCHCEIDVTLPSYEPTQMQFKQLPIILVKFEGYLMKWL